MTEMQKRPGQGAPDVTTTSESTGGSSNSAPLTPEEIARDLDIARELVKAGTPLFVAEPCPPDCGRKGHTPGKGHNGTGFHLPMKWETSAPTLDVVNRWRSGWALAALCGSAVDVLDVDPRNGGDEGAAGLKSAGMWPESYGRATTPSGGTHDLIAPLRVGKGPVPTAAGVDLQGGKEDGTGRGFVFIAPTVRRSKVNGEPHPYRWVVEPDMASLAESAETDDSGAALAAVFTARKASTPAQPVDDGSPFATPADFRPGGSGVAADSPEVIRRVMQLREELAAVPDGDGWEAISEKAFKAGQYVGAGQISLDTATGLMLSALDAWTFRRPGDREQRAQDIRRQVANGAGVPRAWEAARTAENNAEPTVDPVEALLARMLDRDALDSIPAPTPLIRDVIDLESESWIIGAPGGFKSFVALDWACHVATGLTWRGKEVTQGRVVYVAAEGKKGIPLRVKAWEATYGERAEGVLFLPEPVQVADAAAWAVLVEACRRVDPVLIVLDTQARITVGLDENSNGAMSVLTEAVRRLKEATGACVLVVHHTGRNGEDARGASAIDGAQDTEIRVDRPTAKAKRQALTATISMDKQKDGDESTRFEVQLSVVALGTDAATGRPLSSLALMRWDPFFAAPRIEPEWDADLTENQADVLAALRKVGDHERGATSTEVQRAMKDMRKDRGAPPMVPTSFYTARDGLAKRGLIVINGARFFLPEHVAED